VSRINETLKQMIDELDLDRRVNEFSDQAEQAAKRALDKAAEYAHEHRDDVDRLLNRASTSIDERTEGKYADKVTKVRAQLDRGIEKLAERRPADDD
jgi:hypothetical protein